MLEPRRSLRPSATRRVVRRRKKRAGRSAMFAWLVVALGAVSAGLLAFYGLKNGGFAGDAAWRELSAELKKQNEPLAFADLVPPELPEERNFFAAPLFAGVAAGQPESPLLQAAARPVNGKSIRELLTAAAQPDGSVDLAPAAEALAAEAEPDAEYLLPADRVIAGMRKLGIQFDALREAATRPGARFPIDYARPFPPLPHLAPIENLADWLAIDTLARLAAGNGDAAAGDIALIVRLADSVETEPFLDSQRLRRRLLGLAAGCIRAGLGDAAWTDAQLAGFVAMLSRARLLVDFGRAVRGERAQLNSLVDAADKKPDPATVPWLGDTTGRELRMRRVEANRDAQMFLDQLASPEGVRPAALLPPADQPAPPQRLAELAAEAEIFTQVQAYVAQALTACALERHRLAHGAYPPDLDALAPDILAELPRDPLTGRPFEYAADGPGFSLTSPGWEPGKPWKWAR